MIVAHGRLLRDRLLLTSTTLGVMLTAQRTLQSGHPVRFGKERKGLEQTFTLSIHNHELAESLRARGVAGRRAGAIWPDVPHELFGALLRGYFDGDGYAIYRERAGLRVRFTSASAKLLARLSEELQARGLNARPLETDRGASRLWLYGPSAARLGELMYADGGFYIGRKRQAFVDYASARESSARRKPASPPG